MRSGRIHQYTPVLTAYLPVLRRLWIVLTRLYISYAAVYYVLRYLRSGQHLSNYVRGRLYIEAHIDTTRAVSAECYSTDRDTVDLAHCFSPGPERYIRHP